MSIFFLFFINFYVCKDLYNPQKNPQKNPQRTPKEPQKNPKRTLKAPQKNPLENNPFQSQSTSCACFINRYIKFWKVEKE